MNEETLHKQLPIGENEKVLATIKHHWFAYASIYIAAGFICLLVLACLIGLGFGKSQLGISDSSLNAVLVVGVGFMILVGIFSLVPISIKRQEMLVLTEEALLQIKKPSLFASKVSQLNLTHIADVTVVQDTLGSMMGFAKLTIETPGEQDNYEFTVVANAREMAKQIIEAHENYVAALESGQIQTTLGERPPTPGAAWRQGGQVPTQSSGSDDSNTPTISAPPEL